MSEILVALLRLNVVAAAAIGVVLILRLPIRRLFGPRIAYGLWSLVALAVAAMLTPARTVILDQPEPAAAPDALLVVHQGFAPTLQFSAAPNLSAILTALWVVGALAALGWLVRSQIRFDRAAREGRAGPAVVGVVRPRVVVPNDFAGRYSAREQRVVMAHETTHIRRQDSRVNALVAMLRCANWFNPAIHLMAHYLRVDQEFACDAQVIARHPNARRTYGQAMLKTQLSLQPLPLGCYWPAAAAHPLVERVRLLSRPQVGLVGRAVGLAAVSLIVLSGATTVWATRPARVVIAVAPRTPPQTRTPAPDLRAGLARARPQAAAHAPQAVASATKPLAGDFIRTSDDPEAEGFTRRLLPPDEFGPPRKVYGLAAWSSVEPGLAVRVVATMRDPDGHPLTTDLTAFGSQSRYRLGYIRRDDSHYKLFTRVVQHGARLRITAGLNKSLLPTDAGSIDLVAGETGAITLPNGLQVNVAATVRPETAEETAEARGRARVDVMLWPRES